MVDLNILGKCIEKMAKKKISNIKCGCWIRYVFPALYFSTLSKFFSSENLFFPFSLFTKTLFTIKVEYTEHFTYT